MSISTTKQNDQYKRESLSSVARIPGKFADFAKKNPFETMALIAVAVSGLGFLLDKFNVYWFGLTVLLVLLAYGKGLPEHKEVKK